MREEREYGRWTRHGLSNHRLTGIDADWRDLRGFFEGKMKELSDFFENALDFWPAGCIIVAVLVMLLTNPPS